MLELLRQYFLFLISTSFLPSHSILTLFSGIAAQLVSFKGESKVICIPVVVAVSYSVLLLLHISLDLRLYVILVIINCI
jgi:hypothetical protein